LKIGVIITDKLLYKYLDIHTTDIANKKPLIVKIKSIFGIYACTSGFE